MPDHLDLPNMPRAMVLVACLLLFATGCEPATSPPAADAEPRLITLAPGLTQMLIDLELDQHIVGIAEHDALAPPGLPVVGNYTDVNTERLLELSPTHVLTLTTAREPPRRLRDLAAAGRFQLVAYPFPYTVDEVRKTLHRQHDDNETEGPEPLGDLLGVPERAHQLSQQIIDRLDELEALIGDREQPNVLLVIGLNPIMASGSGTVHDELLGWLGARNAARSVGVTAPTFDREALLALAPDVILILSPGARPLIDNDPRLAELRRLPIPAVANDRIHLINNPRTLLASSSLPEVAGLMAEAIHPDLAEQIVVWRVGD